jgi:hypothetical protein
VVRGLTCEECGAPFTAGRKDARFCSDRCGEKYRYKDNREVYLERRRRFYQQNRERLLQDAKRARAANPEKFRTQAKRWRAANPEKVRANNNRGAVLRLAMATNHGRDWGAVYATFWEAQGGCCYLCGDELNEGPLSGGRGRGTTIDHDHRCCPEHRSCPICRRGLACNSCNAGIAYFKDDPGRLRRVADALEQANALVGERLKGRPEQEVMF